MAEVHDGDAVGDVLDDRKVVADEDVGDVVLALQAVEQVEDLGLDGHVECRDGLVAHDDLGAQGQGAGDVDALALAARELVGEAVDMLDVKADLLHEREHERVALLLVGHEAMHDEGLGDEVAAGQTGVQRREGVLEDHLDVLAQLRELLALEVKDVLALKLDGARSCLVEHGHSTAQGGLAAARLADDAERLALVQVEVDVGHGVQDGTLHKGQAALKLELLGQVANLENGLAGALFGCHYSASLLVCSVSTSRVMTRSSLLVPFWRWQATKWLGLTSTSGGTDVRQMSCA